MVCDNLNTHYLRLFLPGVSAMPCRASLGAAGVAVIGPFGDSGRATARLSKLSPRPGSGCCRGAGRPSRAMDLGAEAAPAKRPGAGSTSLFLGAPARSRARPMCCPAVRRTDLEGSRRQAGGLSVSSSTALPLCPVLYYIITMDIWVETNTYPVMGYNTDPMTQPTRRGCPMSLKYALHLTASERQALTRIAQGRGGRRCPPLWQAVRARAGCLGGQREPLARPGRGPRAGRGAGAPAQGAAAPPVGRRGQSATPAAGPVRAAGRPGARDVADAGPRTGDAGDCVPHQL